MADTDPSEDASSSIDGRERRRRAIPEPQRTPPAPPSDPLVTLRGPDHASISRQAAAYILDIKDPVARMKAYAACWGHPWQHRGDVALYMDSFEKRIKITPMKPEIGESVIRRAEDIWTIGSMYTCIRSKYPSIHAIFDWGTGNERFYLRIQTEDDRSLNGYITQEFLVGNVTPDLASGLWHLGPDYLIKVKGWNEYMELESSIIAFVKDHVPTVPVPEVIKGWVDQNRSFIIMKHIKGTPLNVMWKQMTPMQQDKVARDVARIVNEMVVLRSQALMSPNGGAIPERGFLKPHHVQENHPSWKPLVVGPHNVNEFNDYIAKLYSPYGAPTVSNFVLYHGELSPKNILIDKKHRLCAIVDWETCGFYPEYWLATKVVVSPEFWVYNNEGANTGRWSKLLLKYLQLSNFNPHFSTLEEYEVVMSIPRPYVPPVVAFQQGQPDTAIINRSKNTNSGPGGEGFWPTCAPM